MSSVDLRPDEDLLSVDAILSVYFFIADCSSRGFTAQVNVAAAWSVTVMLVSEPH